MSMPWKRVVRWSLFVGALTLLGLGIYRFEPHEPRWTAKSLPVAVDFPYRISADGKTLYASPFAGRKHFDVHLWLALESNRPIPKYLVKWDLATGQPGTANPTKGRLTATPAFSDDGRYFAGIGEWDEMTPEGFQRFVCFVDCESGEELQLPLSCSLDDAEVRFSPCGQYFVVGMSDQPSLLRIYESATGRLLDERCCEGMIRDNTFTKNYLLFVERNDDEQRQAVLWSLHDHNIAARLDVHGFIRASADGKYLLTQGKNEGDWVAWNLHTRKIESEWNSALTSVQEVDLVMVTNHWVACLSGTWKDDVRIESWEIHAGKRHAAKKRIPLWNWDRTNVYAPQGRFRASYRPVRHFRLHSYHRSSLIDPPGGFYIIDIPSLTPLWELDGSQEYRAVFTKDGDHIIVAGNDSAAVQIRDCATGQVQQTIVVGTGGKNAGLTRTKDGRYLLIQHTDDANGHGIWHRLLAWTSINFDRFEPAFRDVTIVYDLETNRERLRLRGWNVADALLSDDGATLVTTHDDEGGRVMRCWDVGATKPWRWPLTIPPLVGAALWGAAKGIARWRQRRADATSSVTAANPAPAAN